jgi:hypothetical protein
MISSFSWIVSSSSFSYCGGWKIWIPWWAMSARICTSQQELCRCVATHPLLEEDDLLLGQGVRLGNHRDEVDLGVESPHELDIDGLETSEWSTLRPLQAGIITTDRLG